ncbi:MAG: IS21-like element helper ATPase IstB [Proteobacteria bacterium]|nr:IS21-like element helper ATPase IstB [Pseudomonadota bacterium]
MTEEIIDKCNELKLKSFATHMDEALTYAQEKNWSYKKLLLHLMALEIERRKQSRIDLRYRQSKLNEQITIDQFDFGYHKSRNSQKNTILNLTNPEFISQKKDVILIGHPGVGKTYLAKCIGYTATQAGIKVLFTTAMDMINQLIAAEAGHSLVKKLSFYQSPALLIIDEIGYLPLGPHGSNLFFQVISSRHQVKSTLITTNLPFSDWGKIFDSTTAATAIADRLVHHSEILVLEGTSYRKKEKKS